MTAKKNLIGLGTIFLAMGFHPASAGDLILRLREPLNSTFQAKQAVRAAGFDSGSKVEIINGEEGVVRIKTVMTPRSDSILNISKNLLYRPAVKYRIKKFSVKSGNGYATKFLAPVDDVLGALLSVMPPVLLPPSSEPAGVDPIAGQDYSLAGSGFSADQADQAGGILTAVIDTGVDYNHEDLISAMWREPGTDGTVVGYDFAHNTTTPFDNVHFDFHGCLADSLCGEFGIGAEKFMTNPGHGTHCAGHVAAVFNNAKGIRGIGAGAKIMALKFFYDVGEEYAGQGDDAAAIKSIDYAIKNGVKVISASWGGRQPRQDADKSELKQALIRAQMAGVLFVVAAGNDAINQDQVDEPSFPAAWHLDNMIVVAATDKNDLLATFSNYGATTVDIAAPGVKILSTTSGGSYSDVIARFKDGHGNEQTIDWDGTSMATPLVAGAAALVWSKFPNEDYRQIRARILSSARPVFGLNGKVATAGVLDVNAALKD